MRFVAEHTTGQGFETKALPAAALVDGKLASCMHHPCRTVSGEIRINGHVSSIAEIKELRGFVPQDDIVHEHLTVRDWTCLDWRSIFGVWQV